MVLGVHLANWRSWRFARGLARELGRGKTADETRMGETKREMDGGNRKRKVNMRLFPIAIIEYLG